MKSISEIEKEEGNCPDCDKGPIVLRIRLSWGEAEYYFFKCWVCGFEYADDKELPVYIPIEQKETEKE